MNHYYKDDWVTIYHGDCMEILPALPKMDLCLTDPPYGIGESKIKNDSRIKGGIGEYKTDYGDFDWDKNPASKEQIDAILSSSKKSIIWGGNYFPLPHGETKWLVLNKLTSGIFSDCELAWTNLGGGLRRFTLLWNGCIRGGEQQGVKRVHPTQKPVELMRGCLSLAPDAKTIIDPFMGSGTTLRAAKDMNRKAIGIELVEKYAEIAAIRMHQEVFTL